MSENLILAAKTDRNKLELSDKFSEFWAAIKDGTGLEPILNLMAIIGVLLIVVALVKWAWDRRRGGGGGGGQSSGAVWGALLVGAILSLPEFLLPAFLSVLDVVANGAIKIWQSPSVGGKTG